MFGSMMSSMPSITGGAGGSASGRNDGYSDWSSPFVVTNIGTGGGLNSLVLIGGALLALWMLSRK